MLVKTRRIRTILLLARKPGKRGKRGKKKDRRLLMCLDCHDGASCPKAHGRTSVGFPVKALCEKQSGRRPRRKSRASVLPGRSLASGRICGSGRSVAGWKSGERSH